MLTLEMLEKMLLAAAVELEKKAKCCASWTA